MTVELASSGVPTEPFVLHERRVWRRWVAAMMAGELVGFAAPAGAGALAYSRGMRDAQLLPVLVVAGALEGAALGYAQSRVLRTEIPNFRSEKWVAATASAAAFAWALGMTPSSLGDFAEEHTVVVAAGAIMLAPVLLVSIGVAQWLVLRIHIHDSTSWIVANGVGWLLGLPAVFIAMMAVPDSAPVAWRAIAGVAGAVAMAGIVAAITGVSLVRLLRSAPTGR